jgi:hypothetical protein
MTRVIKKDEMLRNLKRLAREEPARRQPFCRYVYEDQPCCIIGNLLHRYYGVPLEVLATQNTMAIDSSDTQKLLKERAGLQILTGAAEIAARVQGAADEGTGVGPEDKGPQGMPWGRAVWETLQNNGWC